MEETKVILGKVSVTPKGEYDRSKTYEILDIVSYNGSSYISKINNNTSLPTTGTWQLIAQKGDTYEMQQSDFDKIIEDITTDANSKFNQNVNEKTNAFNTNATQKTDVFNSNATSKTNDYNTNATNKLNEFNQNVRNKTSDFDDNASEKTIEFDTNAEVRLEEYNENADELINKTSELEKEMDDYIGILPKKEATGTTLLEYDKALEFRVINSEIEGNVKQETTSGKNLFDVSLLPLTQNGVTISLDKNGNVVLNGTPNITSGYISFQVGKSFNVQPNTYTLSVIEKKDGIGVSTGGFSGQLNLTLADTAKSKTKTSNSEYNLKPEINVRYDAGTLNNFILNPHLEISSTATSYEPPIGVTPRPDYPQEVETLKPYNLFNLQFIKGAINGDYEIENDVINFIPSSTNVNARIVALIPKKIFEIGEEYNIKALGCNRIAVGYATSVSDTSNYTYFINKANVNSVSFIYTNIPAEYVCIYLYNTNSTININWKLSEIQLKKGAEEKPYVPYGCIAKKYIGKNLFDSKNFKWEKSSNLTYQSIYFGEGIYTISSPDMPNGTNNVCNFFVLPNKVSSGASSGTYGISETMTRQITSTDGYLTIANRNSSVDNNYNPENYHFKIEKGTQKSDYEPYQEHIQNIDLNGNELLSIDKLIIDYKGNAKIEKNWRKVVLDGTETTDKFDYYSYSSDLARFTFKPLNDGTKPQSKYLSNRFLYSGTSVSNECLGNTSSVGLNRCFIYIKKSRLSTQDSAGFKNWLLNNSTGIYYQLATPEIIELPKVEPIKSLEGYNHVEVLATLEPKSMKETYAVDLQAEIEELKNAVISTGANI